MPRNLSTTIHRWVALAACFMGAVHAADSEQWLTYPGKSGPGKGKRVILMAADQEYRSEQSMPMLAKILSQHHGFDCTVLFAVNEKGGIPRRENPSANTTSQEWSFWRRPIWCCFSRAS